MSAQGLTVAEDLDYPSEELVEQFHHLDGEHLLEVMIRRVFPGRIAVSSSLGAESALLLDMVARIDPDTPVIFLDTGMHFPETLEYKDLLGQRFGLTDIRMEQPALPEIEASDPDGRLHETDHDACCTLRKVKPLQRALEGFEAWITGRKRFHGGQRVALPSIELVDGRVKLNPLAGWSAEQVEDAFDQRGLPRHPLMAEGYLSLGCAPCTQKTICGGNARSGRWAGSDKTECGIHHSFKTRLIEK